MEERFLVQIREFGNEPHVMVWDTKLNLRVDFWLGRPNRWKLWRARRYANSLNKHVKGGE